MLSNARQIRVLTVARHMGWNVVARLRGGATGSEFVVPISEAKLSDKNKVESSILRIELEGKKFFCPKQRAFYHDVGLIEAVFNDQVKSIEAFN